MSLVEKFDSVKITEADIMAPEDLSFCELEQSKIDAVLKHLKETYSFMEQEFAKQDNKWYSLKHDEKDSKTSINDLIGRYASIPNTIFVKKKYNYSFEVEENEDFYNNFKYSFAYVLRDINLQKNKAIAYFIRNILEYFTKKYDFELTSDMEVSSNNLELFADYKVLLNVMKESLGGTLNFHDNGLEKAVDEFERLMEYKSITIKKNVLEIENFSYSYSSNFRIKPFDDKSFMALDRIIGIFDKEELTTETHYDRDTFYDGIDYDIHSNKIQSIRLFKNRKIQIKFSDISMPLQFCNRFQLKLKT